MKILLPGGRYSLLLCVFSCICALPLLSDCVLVPLTLVEKGWIGSVIVLFVFFWLEIL